MNRPNTRSQLDIATPARRPRAAWLAAAVGSLFAAAAVAQVPMVILEDVLETTTSLVDLPGVVSGSISARECRDCPSYRLKFTKNTRYFIGNEDVPYAKFREAGAKGSVRLYAYYTPETRALTRLRVVPASVSPTK